MSTSTASAGRSTSPCSPTKHLATGDWVLIHVGFTMSKIDEDEARQTLDTLRSMGQSYVDELDAFANSDSSGTERFEGRAIRR